MTFNLWKKKKKRHFSELSNFRLCCNNFVIGTLELFFIRGKVLIGDINIMLIMHVNSINRVGS